MDIIGLFRFFIDFILHLDTHLADIIAQFGVWTYIILFLIIFLETGLVFTPFLPGDSLLFAAGAFAAIGSLHISVLLLALTLAAIIGDSVNYSIGRYLGLKLFKRYPRVLKQEYLDKTHHFYDKYGAKTIVIARFVPIVRTFAPFVAGIGTMPYRRFISYNIVGGILWVCVMTLAGYFFGNIPFVKENFTYVILAIIIISFVPAIIEIIKHWRAKRAAKAANAANIAKTAKAAKK